jgi:peptidoglycan lytic transglycosylase
MNLQTRLRGSVRASVGIGLVASAAFAPAAAGASDPGGPPPKKSRYERIRVAARNHVLTGDSTVISGYIRPHDRGREVWVEARWRGSGGWRLMARPKTSKRGRFRTAWRPPYLGHYDVRAVLTGSDAVPRRARGGVTVYRASTASWYGPGFYGKRTACGQTLSPGMLGVAHKSLPCGTLIRFYYRGYTVTVPVIDRGPYVGNREWDLTDETKRRLHFPSTGTVWSSPG